MLQLIMGLLAAGLTSVNAQDWPRRAVRRVVPFTAGGGNDISARIIAQPLTGELGRQFIA